MTLFDHLIEKHSKAANAPKEASKQFWEEQSRIWPLDMRETMFGFYDPQNPTAEQRTLLSFINNLAEVKEPGNPKN